MVGRRRYYTRRGIKPHLQDPYLLRYSYKEPTVCPECNLIFHDKRWYWDSSKLNELKKMTVHYQKCPACRKIEDRYPMGIVHLKGEFLKNHIEDMTHLIKNEEKRGLEKNPLERIIKITNKSDEEIIVETTTESLSLRIGRVVKRAFSGEIEYKFSDGVKLIRIEWFRD